MTNPKDVALRLMGIKRTCANCRYQRPKYVRTFHTECIRGVRQMDLFAGTPCLQFALKHHWNPDKETTND